MKKILLVALAIISIHSVADARVYVRSYYRHDGTYVHSHYRSDPDGIKFNNYSYQPNNHWHY